MGTRSLTKIFDGDTLLVTIYRQYDGYMTGHGADLAAILEGRAMTNGIPGGTNRNALFNGPGCMAAQIIRQLKGDEAGNVYIQAPEDDEDYVDYVYSIRNTSDGAGFGMTYTAPRVKVTSYGKTVFEGNVAEFAAAVMQPEEF